MNPQRKRFTPWLFALPALLVFALLNVYPTLFALQISLSNWDGLSAGYDWVGFGNYLEVVRDPDFLRATFTTFAIVGATVVLQSGLAYTHGCTHIWDVWNKRDYVHYRDYAPRFAAEFGFQTPPTWATLQELLDDALLAADSPGMMHHQKAINGQEKLRRGLEEHFGVPEDFALWHFATQLNQARALELGVHHFRSHMPRNMGALYWQLNDCWPVTSWSAVDGYRRKKPLWYASRRFFAPRLLMICPDGDHLTLVASNDYTEPWSGEFTLTRRRFRGDILHEECLSLELPPRTTHILTTLSPELSRAEDKTSELIVAETSNQRVSWFFARDKDLALPEPPFGVELVVRGDDAQLTIKAKSLLRDLTLFVDRLKAGAEMDDQLVTLLPVEQRSFTIRHGATLRREDLLAFPVLCCANLL